MQARTQFQLAMLANGYWPLLNDCKRPIEKGWPKKRPDEAEVRSWDRSAFASTGMKIDGDLAAIDVDVSEAALVETWQARSTRAFPRCFGTVWCGMPADPRKLGSRASISRSGGSPRGAGTAAVIQTTPRR
jgi:hypothetical protein